MKNKIKIIFMMVLALNMVGCGKFEANTQVLQSEEEAEEYEIDNVVSEISEGRVWVSYDNYEHYALIDMLGNVVYSTSVVGSTPSYEPMATPVHNGSTLVHAEPGVYVWLDADGNELYRHEDNDELTYEVIGTYDGNYFIREDIHNINETDINYFIMNGSGERLVSVSGIDDYSNMIEFSNVNDYIYIARPRHYVYEYDDDYLTVFNLKEGCLIQISDVKHYDGDNYANGYFMVSTTNGKNALIDPEDLTRDISAMDYIIDDDLYDFYVEYGEYIDEEGYVILGDRYESGDEINCGYSPEIHIVNTNLQTVTDCSLPGGVTKWECGEISGGYAYVYMRDSGQNVYFTVVDTEGELGYSPIKMEKDAYGIVDQNNGYILFGDDTLLTIDGTIINLENGDAVSLPKDLRIGSVDDDYVISEGIIIGADGVIRSLDGTIVTDKVLFSENMQLPTGTYETDSSLDDGNGAAISIKDEADEAEDLQQESYVDELEPVTTPSVTPSPVEYPEENTEKIDDTEVIDEDEAELTGIDNSYLSGCYRERGNEEATTILYVDMYDDFVEGQPCGKLRIELEDPSIDPTILTGDFYYVSEWCFDAKLYNEGEELGTYNLSFDLYCNPAVVHVFHFNGPKIADYVLTE